MNNIQTVGNFALKNQQNPEVETQQNNVRKINFKADYQGQPRYTQPAILQQQPQQEIKKKTKFKLGYWYCIRISYYCDGCSKLYGR